MNVNDIPQPIIDNMLNGNWNLVPFKIQWNEEKKRNEKYPAFHEWNGVVKWQDYAASTPEQLQEMLNKCTGDNIILQAVLKKVFCQDFDMHADKETGEILNGGGMATLSKWDEQFEYVPTLTFETPTNGGQKRMYSKPSGTYADETKLVNPDCNLYPQVETLVVATAVWGKGYKILDASSPAYRPDYLYGIIEKPKYRMKSRPSEFNHTPEQELELAEHCVKSLSRFRSDDRESWIDVCMVLCYQAELHPEYAEKYKALAIEFSKECRSKWSEEEYKFDNTWETLNPRGDITMGSLVQWAGEDDTKFVNPLVKPSMSKKEAEELNESLDDIMEDADDEGLPELTKNKTELGNAVRLIEMFGDKWYWCDKDKPRKSCFRVWNGKFWEDDENGHQMWAFYEDMVRVLYKEAYETKGSRKRAALAKHALYSEKSYMCEATLKWASKKHSIDEDAFDADPELFNCDNGIINLRTGELLPHGSEYMCHRISPLTYDPSAGTNSKFVDFHKWEVEDDEPSLRFIQKLYGVGYSGRSPKAIPLVLGKGDSGKSGIFETLLHGAGTYGQKTSIEAFCKSDFGNDAGDKPNSYKVRLKGARFVVANEVREGMLLDNAQWKDLSGGDSLTTRGQHQTETTDFKPSHLMFIYGNHKPGVKDEDDAIWNRLCEIKFAKVIPVEQRLPDTDYVKEMYLKESSQILNWIVQGYQMWLQDGHLRKPERVENATNEHRQSEDTFLMWLRDEYEEGDGYTTYKSALQEAFEAYVKADHLKNVNTSQKYITRRMTELGYILFGNGRNQIKGIRKMEIDNKKATIGKPINKTDETSDDL